MPIYEYLCIKCNNIFSALQKMGATEKETCCPGCGSNDVKKKVLLVLLRTGERSIVILVIFPPFRRRRRLRSHFLLNRRFGSPMRKFLTFPSCSNTIWLTAYEGHCPFAHYLFFRDRSPEGRKNGT